MSKYKVVRTYDDGSCKINDLQKCFDEGYKFVRASEFIPENKRDGKIRFGYIEYILVKETDE